MAEPTITETPAGYRVTCAEHHLDRTVETEKHAGNLLALHLRKDHPAAPPSGLPDTIHVTALAKWVTRLDASPHLRGGPYRGALDAWCEATGAPDDETALAWARAFADTLPPVHATIPPF